MQLSCVMQSPCDNTENIRFLTENGVDAELSFAESSSDDNTDTEGQH